MLLNRLKVVNFRQYQNLELNFPDGITGIVGRNGSGKSTILEAILWCLYGNRAARSGKEGIRRQTASEADNCEVALEFKLGERDYRLERSLVGKNSRSEARLLLAGRLDAVSTREVDDYIVHLIGLDLKGFLSSFHARQKELNALSDARPAERKDHLAKMLGVGRLDNAITLLKQEIKDVRGKIDFITRRLADPDELKRLRVEKEAVAAGAGKERDELEKSINELGVEIAEISKTVEKMKGVQKRFQKLQNLLSVARAKKEAVERDIIRIEKDLADIKSLAAGIDELAEELKDYEKTEAEVNRLKSAARAVEEYQRLKRDLEALKESVAKKTAEKDDLQDKIAGLAKECAEKPATLNELKEAEIRRDNLREKFREITGREKVLASDLEKLEKQKSQIKDLGPEAVCDLCLRPFGEEFSEIERHFEQEINSLRQRLAPLKGEREEIQKSGEKLNQEIERLGIKRDALVAKETVLATMQTKLESLSAGLVENAGNIKKVEKRLNEMGEIAFDPELLKASEDRLAVLKTRKEEFIRLRERAARGPELNGQLQNVCEALGKIETELKSADDELSTLDFDEEKFRKHSEELEQKKDGQADKRLELERLDSQLRVAETEIRELTRRLDEFEKSQEEIKNLRTDLTYLEKLSLLFSEFRVFLIGRIRPVLSERTSELFHDMTDGRYREIELDEDYNLCIFDRGESFPLNRFSGGEIDLANLCFRLAISVEMAATAGINQSFIILDEIFGSQDSERQRLIVEGLGRLKNRFRQIIIVSHIDDVKEMAENIITVEATDGISRAVFKGA